MKTEHGFNFGPADYISQEDALHYLMKAEQHAGKREHQETNDILDDMISVLKQLIILYDQVEWNVVDYKTGENLPKTNRQVEVVMIGEDGEPTYFIDRFFGYTILPDDDDPDVYVQCGNWEYWEEDYPGQRIVAWREIAHFEYHLLDE